MTQKKLITMTSEELTRYEIINNLINGKINGTEAAKMINLSVRQVKNLKAAVKKKGARGLIHGNRGRESNRKLPEEKIKEIKKVIKDKYKDFGPTLASEKLEETDKIKINHETLRQLMTEWGYWKPKPRKTNKEYRCWRPRKEYYGEMEQYDGSYHHWFENRAPECCLLASIDDATGKITKAKFDYHEGIIPTFNFWKEYTENKGKPLNIYLDRFSTYKINHKSAEDNKELMTQFQRAMKDLGINLINANSPEAKGRIERLFKTLQDRLVKELRLANISTIEEANIFLEKAFIPKFNEKFGVTAQKKGDLHKKLTELDKKNIDKIFSIQKYRVVCNDFTVRFEKKWFQLDETQPTLVRKKEKVLVEERINGDIFISLRGKYLNYTKLPRRPLKIINVKIAALTRTKSSWKPPIDHPWRNPFLKEKQKEKLKVVNSLNR